MQKLLVMHGYVHNTYLEHSSLGELPHIDFFIALQSMHLLSVYSILLLS